MALDDSQAQLDTEGRSGPEPALTPAQAHALLRSAPLTPVQLRGAIATKLVADLGGVPPSSERHT